MFINEWGQDFYVINLLNALIDVPFTRGKTRFLVRTMPFRNLAVSIV